MKFRIEKEILSTKTNIRGKVLEEDARWVVYRLRTRCFSLPVIGMYPFIIDAKEE